MGSRPECQRHAKAQEGPPRCRPCEGQRRQPAAFGKAIGAVQPPLSLPRAREGPSLLLPAGHRRPAPVPRRILIIALAAAAVFAAVLGAASPAQDATPTSSPESTATAPVESAAPVITTAP